ncbi:hypothetical protein BDP27DRAFT_942325 [Rhodocollybia butyracea]|uniref:Uncharacterized protein n=1 Tax=Rhodocollybia butyracea TaxID=206335 RepID=A0A9P5U5V3_9AGAR|nr:hypothetical protein BDP27DRAFT_942325 [Rhodocollybia butyracea]
MNRKKLNTLAKRNYQPSSGWSSAEDEYEPSQQLSPLPKKARFAEGNDGTPLTPPRPSFLMSLETNKSNSLKIYLPPTDLLQPIFTWKNATLISITHNMSPNLRSTGRNCTIPQCRHPLPNSCPHNITADEDSLTVAEVGQVTEEFCPHLATSCLCVDFLLTQYHQLNDCLAQERSENEQLIAKNFQQKVRLERLKQVLTATVQMVPSDPSHAQENERVATNAKKMEQELMCAQNEAREARAAQETAEEFVRRLRRDILVLLQD